MRTTGFQRRQIATAAVAAVVGVPSAVIALVAGHHLVTELDSPHGALHVSTFWTSLLALVFSSAVARAHRRRLSPAAFRLLDTPVWVVGALFLAAVLWFSLWLVFASIETYP